MHSPEDPDVQPDAKHERKQEFAAKVTEWTVNVAKQKFEQGEFSDAKLEAKMREGIGQAFGEDKANAFFDKFPPARLLSSSRFRSAVILYMFSSMADFAIPAPFPIVGTIAEVLTDAAVSQGILMGLKQANVIDETVRINAFDNIVAGGLTSLIGVPDAAAAGLANSTVGAAVNPALIMLARVTAQEMMRGRKQAASAEVVRPEPEIADESADSAELEEVA
jgi:hypothetical protein